MTSLAAAGPQHGRADAAGAPDLVIELQQVGRQIGGDLAALAGCLRAVGVDVGEGRVPLGGQGLHLAAQALAFRGHLVAPADEGLPAFHQLEHDLLEVALPAVQRLDLGLQAGELARGGDLARVQPGPVLVDPGPDLLDVALGPALLPGQVAELGLGLDDGVLQLARPGLKAGQFGDFRQALPATGQADKLGVQVGQFEQAELILR